jgi:peptidoglycan-N-acetylglucosamine deacetylase
MTVEIALYILYAFSILIVFLVLLISSQKFLNNRNQKLRNLARDYLFKRYFDQENVRRPFSSRFFLDAYIDIETQVEIEPDIREEVIKDLSQTYYFKKQFRKLNSLSKYKRKTAIFYLGSIKTNKAIEHLIKRFKKEKNYSVKFFLVYQLIHHLNQDLMDIIIDSLMTSKQSYQKWIFAILNNHYFIIKDYLTPYYESSDQIIKKLLIHLASNQIDPKLKNYCLRLFHEQIFDEEIRYEALSAVSKIYPDELIGDDYFFNKDIMVRKISVNACSNIIKLDVVDKILDSLDGSELDILKAQALSRITYDSKKLLIYVFEYFNKTTDKFKRRAIARVLSHRIDYLMLKLKSGQFSFTKQIIEEFLELRIVEDFIDFMNSNKDLELEKELLIIIRKFSSKDTYLLDQFSIYLNQSLLKQMGILKRSQPQTIREKAAIEKNKIVFILTWVSIAVVFFPLLFLLTNFRLIFSGNVNVFELLITRTNYYLVFYFLTVNTIYLILLLISVKGANERIDMWNIKRQTFLFTKNLLPSISIVAPAYNEEKSIIESVTSLLNLKYPKYEVIVVNDGSKDRTIDVLIEHFDLERKHPFFNQKLKTKQLRGVYVNKVIPNLIVIDKENGGKADALNLGINVAKNDYVCGIDADSLLEENALLKLMSVTLDDTKEHIALGGNIVPVNGCVVDKGKVEKSGLSNKPVVLFQTLEYLRAFTTGRIGWSKLNSLLIISGAFGLFKRTTLLDTGGYLTISGDLKKDTVGEDMELVVRLTYQALKKKMPYKVTYVHHANCYTELPSDYRSLFKQRNRWQRGLLDILSYHKRILFNPKFKQPGLIAFPYFFIFEMLGPFIEGIGYIALLIGLFLGILNETIVILLFIATIGYGIIISLFSLLIAEKKNVYYSNKETLLLILVAILENFGYRQVMSLHRIISTFSALRESGNWGSQKRVGFSKK